MVCSECEVIAYGGEKRKVLPFIFIESCTITAVNISLKCQNNDKLWFSKLIFFKADQLNIEIKQNNPMLELNSSRVIYHIKSPLRVYNRISWRTNSNQRNLNYQLRVRRQLLPSDENRLAYRNRKRQSDAV